jgi:hypothetical protein
VYDKDMKEQGRFIEVEVNKDKVSYLRHQHYSSWLSHLQPEDGATHYLSEQEKLLNKIGISPQNRLKKSLFEMYIKDK